MTDFAARILNLEGEEEQRPIDGNGANRSPDNLTPVTLGWVCRSALSTDMATDRDQTGDQKIARISLALRIPNGLMAGSAPVTLTAEEVTLIRQRVSQVFGAMLTYRVAELLDPASVAPKS